MRQRPVVSAATAVVFMAFVCATLASESKFWVFLSDQSSCPCSSPSPPPVPSSLSAVLRRHRNSHHSPDPTVCPDHRETLTRELPALLDAPLVRLVGESRWLNALSFRGLPSGVSASSVEPLIMSRFPFVTRVTPVASRVPRVVPDEEEEEEVVTSRRTGRSLNYGSSLEQLVQAGVTAVHERGINGTGVKVLVLDGGFMPNHTAFASLGIVGSRDFVNDGRAAELNTMRHGTGTLSVLAGYMPGVLVGSAFGVEVLLARTENSYSETPQEEDNFVMALEWGESLGADVATASLGYSDWYNWTDFDGTSVIARACDEAFARGMVVLSSAGNDGVAGIVSPADSKTIIAVGSVTSSGMLSEFSSCGPSSDMRVKPDVCARGSAVTVASPYGPAATAVSSGTSFSCPMVAGVVALIISAHPNWTSRMVRDAVLSTSSFRVKPNIWFGFGVVNATAAIAFSPPQGQSSFTSGLSPSSCAPILTPPRRGADCTQFGCVHGSCVNGTCRCREGFYDIRCNLPKIACQSFCVTDRADCLASGWCVCRSGQTARQAGVNCQAGAVLPPVATSSATALSPVASLVSSSSSWDSSSSSSSSSLSYLWSSVTGSQSRSSSSVSRYTSSHRATARSSSAVSHAACCLGRLLTTLTSAAMICLLLLGGI